tara:strand:- start:1245 stop:2510 length:1266 start_codon:yes stop_codon:yes gene_type:complete
MLFFILILMSFSFSNEELVDGVLAVVENNHILFSEVLGESRMLAEQKNINPQTSPMLFQSVFDAVLKEKINIAVVLSVAEKDSSIDVSYEEINRSIDERISMFAKQLGSEKKLEEAFGLSIADIKNNFWETVRKEIVVEKFKYSLLGDVSITKNEVFSFYNTYKDSIPSTPPLGSFSLIHKKIELSSNSTKKILDKLYSIKDSVDVLKYPFESFVLKYSEDPSVSLNNGIMTTNRGDLVPEYEKTAYSLQINEIGKPTQTSFGFHLIKLLNRVGEKITSQHLLITTKPAKEDSLSVVSFLDSLLEYSSNDPGLFDSLSFTYKQSRLNLSGNYTDVDISLFPPIIINKVKTMIPFTFSPVFGDNINQYILYKYNFKPETKRSIDSDWIYVESLALNKKRSDLFNMWIEKQIEKTYVKINKKY